jgi:hypothetical protein
MSHGHLPAPLCNSRVFCQVFVRSFIQSYASPTSCAIRRAKCAHSASLLGRRRHVGRPPAWRGPPAVAHGRRRHAIALLAPRRLHAAILRRRHATKLRRRHAPILRLAPGRWRRRAPIGLRSKAGFSLTPLQSPSSCPGALLSWYPGSMQGAGSSFTGAAGGGGGMPPPFMAGGGGGACAARQEAVSHPPSMGAHPC